MNKKELTEKIEQTEQLLSKLKAELERLEKEPTIERMGVGEEYFTVLTDFGEPYAHVEKENYGMYDNARFDLNNYFLSKERAQEVADKMKFLLKLERFHDIYCPDYKPDWQSGEPKHYVLFDDITKEFKPCYTFDSYFFTRTYFPDEDTAQKVCDRLNEEVKADVCFFGAEHQPKATQAWNRRADGDDRNTKT